MFKKLPITLEKKNPPFSIYNIKIHSISNTLINLRDFKGKKILFVNVASKCGFTPQYYGLQKLYEENIDKLMVIGLPCNQFAFQEPGDNIQINNFCKSNYGVNFLITEKVKVYGFKKHSLYNWLTNKKENGVLNSYVKWNFQKYLIDETGSLKAVFPPKTKPFDEIFIDQINN
tara:strand:+ start:279 stop:797 length:519 start_codon:yes stop_codon:yes gene_type:complete